MFDPRLVFVRVLKLLRHVFPCIIPCGFITADVPILVVWYDFFENIWSVDSLFLIRLQHPGHQLLAPIAQVGFATDLLQILTIEIHVS